MWAQEKGEGRTRSHAPQVVSGGPLVGLRGHRGTRTQMASGCGTDIGAAAGGAPVGTRERRGRAAVGSVCRPIRAGAPGAQTRPYQRPTRGQPRDVCVAPPAVRVRACGRVLPLLGTLAQSAPGSAIGPQAAHPSPAAMAALQAAHAPSGHARAARAGHGALPVPPAPALAHQSACCHRLEAVRLSWRQRMQRRPPGEGAEKGGGRGGWQVPSCALVGETPRDGSQTVPPAFSLVPGAQLHGHHARRSTGFLAPRSRWPSPRAGTAQARARWPPRPGCLTRRPSPPSL